MRILFFFLASMLFAACAEAPLPPKTSIPVQPAAVTPVVTSPPPQPPRPDVPAEEAVCAVRVDAIGKKYRVKVEAAGKTPDSEAMRRDAHDRACSAMAKAEGAGCTDPPGFSEVTATVMKLTNGKMTREVVVSVRPVKRTVEGTGRAPVASPKFEACKIALANACSTTPADTTCTASGVHCVQTAPNALACSPGRSLSKGEYEKSWPLENNMGLSPFDRDDPFED